MTPQLVFRPEARVELLDAQAWYEASVPGLGSDFAGVVDAALTAIVRSPRTFPIVYRNIRQAVLRRFPYSLLFELEERHIVVLACHHQRRDRRRWQERGRRT